jgi:hypothetical protein
MLVVCAIINIQIASFLDVEVGFGKEGASSKSKKVWP